MSRLLRSTDIDVAKSNSPLGFETAGGGSWPKWHRYLTLDGKRAYEVGNICSTCTFFFERMEGANSKVEVEDLVARLAAGMPSVDEMALQKLSAMIPNGHYTANFVGMVPRAVELGAASDYFVNEQQAVWGLDAFWGLPHNPRVPYYRTGERAISTSQRLFELVVPMYPRNWLQQDQVVQYRKALEDGCEPTAVAISLLDVKGPATTACEEFEHWCLAHYVLDGHHKIEAASQLQKPITMVSFLSKEHGASTPAQVGRIRELLDF